MKGVIVYKGKYGATLQYAIWLGAALNLQVLKTDLAKPEAWKIAEADYVIIGTSVYIGKLQVAAWLKQNAPLLEGKKLVFFIVAGTPQGETEKLMSYYIQGVPESLRRTASVYFLPGSLQYSRLSLLDKILLRMGSRLAAKKGEMIHMNDYNDVKKENLAPVIRDARSFDTIPILT
ncbi:flavodoxin domain-containing protein [Chitinophaga sp. 22620]|uniref:flavodoxin domain-containing protein n=1 Tax=Chitinophaga sp. 22620 TaxID=3453952 RepID=UPI003F84982B